MRLELLDELIPGVDQLAQLDEAGPETMLRDLKDRALGFVEQIVGVLLGVVRARQHVGRGLNQPPEGRLFLDDPGVVLDVRRTRHAVRERRNVGGTADFLELPGPRELVLERDQVDRLAAIGEPDHLLEDAPVRIAEEVGGVDDLGGLIERLVVDEHRTKHALLGFEIVRKGAVHVMTLAPAAIPPPRLSA